MHCLQTSFLVKSFAQGMESRALPVTDLVALHRQKVSKAKQSASSLSSNVTSSVSPEGGGSEWKIEPPDKMGDAGDLI